MDGEKMKGWREEGRMRGDVSKFRELASSKMS